MQRFQPFVGRPVNRTRIGESSVLEKAGFVARYLPEEFDEFDEMEFTLPFEEEKSLVLSVALEQGRIMRILIGWVGPGDPDDAMRSFDEKDLKRALDLKGDDMARFLEDISG